jgi:hypothetical protein
VTFLSGMAATMLWDTGYLDTCEIASALGVPEFEIANFLHHMREERRARA